MVTGKGSYIGANLIKWLDQWPEIFEVEEISLREDSWKLIDFSKYNVILHLAAIVHQKEKSQMEQLYFTVNTDLPLAVATKAKNEGVRQFIFMSSMSVYGVEGSIGKVVNIDKDFPCNPKSFYGKSKLAAEQELLKMESNDFKIAVIRAPMIYGPNCPGNFKKLRKISLMIPVFPKLINKRSMIFIDNLSEFMKFLIVDEKSGVFFPQNIDFISTYELVSSIASYHKKKFIFQLL